MKTPSAGRRVAYRRADCGPRRTLSRGLLAACAALAAATHGAAYAGESQDNFSAGGNVAITSDYIYQGVSESDGHPALQADVHAGAGGWFLGAWASTRDRDFPPGASSELEAYLGHRFNLDNTWSATLSARSHYFLRPSQTSADFQELSASVAWLDRWTFTLAAIPNAVRWYGYVRLNRSPAWVADTAGQWLLGRGVSVTGAIGYYYSTSAGAGEQAGAGYAYGNVGLAYEERQWRVDVGYFLAQNRAQQLFPYPAANRQVAGTVSWRF
ncbi:MAG: TorF family putative porin [Steroidobacterales bacterium]